MNDGVKKRPSWEDYLLYITDLMNQIEARQKKFDVIVGLTRGGLIPGVILSHRFNIPLIPFNPHLLRSSGEERKEIRLPISPEVVKCVLIVDDVADTGRTFTKCRNFFEKMGLDVITATVYINKESSIFVPNYAVKDSEGLWVVFPYEEEGCSE